MKTQLESARDGITTKQMEAISRAENMDIETLLSHVACGSVVIMNRGDVSVGIGKGLSTKVNVNLGTSSLKIEPDEEVKKARIAQMYGADTITDLSMGGNISDIRCKIMQNTTLPITTVPIYQSAAEKSLGKMNYDDIIRNLRQQADEGMSSFVLHCIDKKTLDILKKGKRKMDVVSKGGSITSAYMMLNDCENPFISNFEGILEILKKYDIVLSLGNTMRSGCIHDKRDKAQVSEIKQNRSSKANRCFYCRCRFHNRYADQIFHLDFIESNGMRYKSEQNIKLAKIAHEAGVQAIIEGVGGHIRADRISEYVRFHKKQSDFPLFVAGPLPTDVAVGYDHIAGSVGASIASGAGADYLCYITPSEHLGLPRPEQVREGLIAFKVAAHIGDSIKYGPDERDRNLARKRVMLDWEGQMKYAIDSDRARELSPKEGPCTMCGDFCAIKIMKEFRNPKDAKNG